MLWIGCLHTFKLKNHIKPNAPHLRNESIFHIESIPYNLERCEKVRANFQDFFNLHYKNGYIMFFNLIYQALSSLLTWNFIKMIKYKMFISDLSQKKVYNFFSKSPHPKPLCYVVIFYLCCLFSVWNVFTTPRAGP